MFHYTADDIESHFSYGEFIPYLKEYFTKEISAPQRPHYPLQKNQENADTLLLMPAWQIDKHIGIKLITVFENNVSKNLNTINGIYLLINGNTGLPLCTFDAALFTSKRTAAASALASSFLSRKDSKTLTIIGTGNLCHELIAAHSAVRELNDVRIWGRNHAKAIQKADSYSPTANTSVIPVEHIDDSIAQSDIVSSATFAKEPLIQGQYIKDGTHIDLVGSYQPGYREADDELISKSSVYIDTPAALHETGELLIPIKNKVISESDIKSNLIELCKGKHPGRENNAEITWFKSVGYALEDLAMGVYLYEKSKNNV